MSNTPPTILGGGPPNLVSYHLGSELLSRHIKFAKWLLNFCTPPPPPQPQNCKEEGRVLSLFLLFFFGGGGGGGGGGGEGRE